MIVLMKQSDTQKLQWLADMVYAQIQGQDSDFVKPTCQKESDLCQMHHVQLTPIIMTMSCPFKNLNRK